MIKSLERLKSSGNIWPTYDLSVRTEAGPNSTTRVLQNERYNQCSNPDLIGAK
jgi:hypothetical protein